ncbi:MAG: hypothetical protein Fur0046_37590 [Cyanobacteria bacterium J069]|nr:MAG: hypothetical protein D6742_06185 [Cyanobacteria bacterium J069]
MELGIRGGELGVGECQKEAEGEEEKTEGNRGEVWEKIGKTVGAIASHSPYIPAGRNDRLRVQLKET